jgi:hypothetical protein
VCRDMTEAQMLDGNRNPHRQMSVVPYLLETTDQGLTHVRDAVSYGVRCFASRRSRVSAPLIVVPRKWELQWVEHLTLSHYGEQGNRSNQENEVGYAFCSEMERSRSS